MPPTSAGSGAHPLLPGAALLCYVQNQTPSWVRRFCRKIACWLKGGVRHFFSSQIKESGLGKGSYSNSRAAGCKLHPNKLSYYSASPAASSCVAYVLSTCPMLTLQVAPASEICIWEYMLAGWMPLVSIACRAGIRISETVLDFYRYLLTVKRLG